jgi:hypothetical protein
MHSRAFFAQRLQLRRADRLDAGANLSAFRIWTAILFDHQETASTLLLREQYKQADKLTFIGASSKLLPAGDNQINAQCPWKKSRTGLCQANSSEAMG